MLRRLVIMPLFTMLRSSGSHSLVQLQDHIAHKCLADDDIRSAMGNLPRLNAADEVDVPDIPLEGRKRLLHQSIALLLLCPDIDDGRPAGS